MGCLGLKKRGELSIRREEGTREGGLGSVLVWNFESFRGLYYFVLEKGGQKPNFFKNERPQEVKIDAMFL